MTKTTKLCVIDLEWLTESACGAEAPESPTDQALLPGVKDAIDRYRADGWHLAIVANIPDCTSKMKASDVCVGNCVIRDGSYYQVEAIDPRVRGELVFKYDKDLRTGTQWEWFGRNDEVLYSGISPKQMIEMATFAADLCGIENVYFCPDVSGKTMYELVKVTIYGWGSMVVSEQDFEYLTGSINPKYRLPDMGMLTYAKSARVFPDNKSLMVKSLMVGSGYCEQTAIEAGFEFMSAHEFCKSGAA